MTNPKYLIKNLPSIEAYKSYLMECGKKPATIDSYARDAQQFLKFCQLNNIKDIEPDCIKWFKKYLEEKNEKTNSIRRSVIGVRQFARYHFDLLELPSPIDEEHIPSRQEIIPDYLNSTQLQEIFRACQNTEVKLKELRDRAIVCLLGYEGLKASELIGLDWSHFITSESENIWSLKIFGTKTRTIELNKETTIALENYKNKLIDEHDSTQSLPFKKVFIGFKGRQAQAKLTKMSRHGLKFMLSEVGENAKIKSLSTEKLRHHAIAYMITHKKTPEEVMAHLGLKRLGNIAKFVHSK